MIFIKYDKKLDKFPLHEIIRNENHLILKFFFFFYLNFFFNIFLN